MAFTLHSYTLIYTYPPGVNKRKKKLSTSLGGDADAKTWAKYVVEQAQGGSAEVQLLDGSTFTYP